MAKMQRVPDDLPGTRTPIEDDEAATDALLRAAKRAHVGLRAESEDSQLHTQIDADALDRLTDHHESVPTASDYVIVVELWDQTFVIKPDVIEVFP